MNKVNPGVIKQLLETEDNATLSLYMPTHRFPTSDHISEDKIRFKNLIRAGKEALEEQGVSPEIIEHMTQQLENTIYEDNTFWQNTTEGTAIFCSPASVKAFNLPVECDEYISAGDSYDIAPLLVAASYDQPFYLLALAKKNPILLYGDMYGLERVAIDLPKSAEEALNIDELFSNSRTMRAGSGAGNPGAKAHGQGDSKQAGQEERLKFFRMIDEKILSSKIIDNSAPFILAGTNDEVSAYKEVSHIKHILNSSLSGNYTDIPFHDTHARSWPLIIHELCDQREADEVEKLGNLLGTGRASTDNEAIAQAAAEGRVDTLLVGILTKTRDGITDASAIITKLVFTDNYKANRIDAVARSVFDQGGKVIGTLKGSLSSGVMGAAIYRY